MDLRPITDSFSVSPQIEVADVPAIRDAGYRAILCNRPDDEEFGQCPCDDIAQAAEAAGLAFRVVPITSGMVTEADMVDFRAALAELPGPVLAYCRSGTRCTMLWTIAQVGDMDPDEIVRRAAEAGYDMRGIVGQMTRR